MGKDSKKEKKPVAAKTIWKRIGSTVFTVVIFLLLAMLIYTFVQLKTGKRPNLFGYGVYTVVSGSMVPTLEIGDVIVVKTVKNESELKNGDIITFIGKGDLAGKTVTHRIISDGVEAGQITTCGDANHGIADKPISFSDVIGKYQRTSVFLSYIYKTFRSKTGFAAIVFVPLIVLLIIQVVNFVHACKMKEDDKENAEQSPEDAVKQKEDEIRRKAIEEYIASKKRLEDAQKKKSK